MTPLPNATEAAELHYVHPDELGWNAQRLQKGIDSLIHAALDSQAFPGCQVLVAYQGQVLFHQAYGSHTYAGERRVSLADVYDLASITKIAGPLPLLMKLVGSGKLDLDQPFSLYWPAFQGGEKAVFTLREVLAHQARLMPYIVFWQQTLRKSGRFKWRTFKADSSRRYPVKTYPNLYLHRRYRLKMQDAVRKSPLNPEPGYVYSGLSFLLYPDLIEQLSGEDYQTMLRREIYDPIGAKRLGYNPAQRIPLRHIVPTEYDSLFRRSLVHGYVHDEAAAMLGGVSGNAGLFSNAWDLARLMQLYLNGGAYTGKQILPAEVLAEFSRYQYPDSANRRGLGFDKPPLEPEASRYIAGSASPESFGHSGFTGTFIWADPKYGLLLVFLSNRVYPTRNNRKLYSLNFRPNLHQFIYDQMFLAQAKQAEQAKKASEK